MRTQVIINGQEYTCTNATGTCMVHSEWLPSGAEHYPVGTLWKITTTKNIDRTLNPFTTIDFQFVGHTDVKTGQVLYVFDKTIVIFTTHTGKRLALEAA